jgi:hypothetical protein
MDRFYEIIDTGNEKGWFVDEKNNAIQLPRLQFILDVKTRWDSVYNMTMRFLENRQVRASISHLGK